MTQGETGFRELIEQSSGIIYTLDKAGNTTYISPKWHEMLGAPAESVRGKHFSELIHPDDVPKCTAFLLDITNGKKNSDRIEYRVRHADGTWRWHTTFAAVLQDDSRNPIGLIGIAQDITEQKSTAEKLAISEERHRLLAENANDVVWTMSTDGSIGYVSPAIERVRGITPAEAMTQTLDQIHTPQSMAMVMDYFGKLQAAVQNGHAPEKFRGELEYLRKDGSIMWADVQVIPLLAEDGKLIELLGVSRDISERKEYEESIKKAESEVRLANQALAEANIRLERLAATDMLTGARNRRYFEQRSTSEMAESIRYGQKLSLIMLDIDHFKAINDQFGHLAGDHVLQTLVARLQGNLRTSDLLARWGGEEFIVLLPHSTLPGAELLAEKLRSVTADSPFPEVGRVSISLGVTEFHPGEEFDQWLQRADQALYRAKSEGRNTVRSMA